MKKCLNSKFGAFVVASIFSGACLAANKSWQFNADEFAEHLKKQGSQNSAENLISTSFKKGEIKYTADYIVGKGKGYYLRIAYTNKSTMVPEYWGPYKTFALAQEAAAGLPKDSGYKVIKIELREGAFANSASDLNKSLLSGTDTALKDCYTLQLKEVEKINSDEHLNAFFRYMMIPKNSDPIHNLRDNSQVKIQMLDLRTGVPGQKLELPLGDDRTFRITAMLDVHGNCRVTTLQDLQFQLSPKIEQHKKLIVAKTKEVDLQKERRHILYNVIQEQHDRLLKRVSESQPLQPVPPVIPGRANTGTGV